jgi:hypothetical protein
VIRFIFDDFVSINAAPAAAYFLYVTFFEVQNPARFARATM